MNVGLDIMGGDFAPKASLDGVAQSLPLLGNDVMLTLFGHEPTITRYFEQHNLPTNQVTIVGTTQVVEMGESPTKAIMKKPESSISVGMKYLGESKIDAYISAGNTGAVLVASMYLVKVIEGVIRPAISSLLPRMNGSYGILLDVGANPDSKPDVLYQFGVLGSLYAKHVLNIPNPKVGLLNIGEEKEKGNLATQAAYDIFENSSRINFTGNVEGYDIFSDKVDVIACDGFVGNVVLKSSEALFRTMKEFVQDEEMQKRLDYQYYGGTPILGVRKPVLIGHGVSSPLAFQSMIQQAIEMVKSDLIEKVKTTFEP
ncbi:MAG: phosphate acyltransferase PlsX [Bacteroidetes bacterium]|nr:phosphate acyltransferase PlsX [Bacteroidota bacterium]